jgi:hypothetical protein
MVIGGGTNGRRSEAKKSDEKLEAEWSRLPAWFRPCSFFEFRFSNFGLRIFD